MASGNFFHWSQMIYTLRTIPKELFPIVVTYLDGESLTLNTLEEVDAKYNDLILPCKSGYWQTLENRE